ncbi:hypothetical protein G9A89_004890 [Geosiphon pyriformis]|nr:hypothetical protein G9A89_004890 [Geosiphon pyriformis]
MVLGGVSTFSKFAEIIRAMFTSKLGLIKTTEKATSVKIVVNTNLKKFTGCSDWAVVLKKIPIGILAKAVHATLSKFDIIKSIKIQLFILIEKDAVHVARSNMNKESWDTRCTAVCFDLAESLNAIMGTTPVLRSVNLHWSCLILAKCLKCKNFGHISLNYMAGEKSVSSGASTYRIFSNTDKSRLFIIYAKHLAPVAHPISFSGISWVKIVDESSFSLFLVYSSSAYSSSFLEMKPLSPVFLDLNVRFAVLECSLASLAKYIDQLVKRLNTSGPIVSQSSPECQPLIISSSQNQGANIVMSESLDVATRGETIAKVMIVNKFGGVCVFTSGLNSSYLGSGVVVVMNNFLARHVCKISEVLGWLLFIKLFFKNKLSVLILGLYTRASLIIHLFQADEINSLMARAVNESFFIVFGGNFNKNDSHRCTSFKKCLDLELVNSLVESLAVVVKIIDYVFVSSNLVSALVYYNILNVSKHFNTNHQTVSVSCEFKVSTAANAVMFSDEFVSSMVFSNLDSMWNIFKSFNSVFTKSSFRFHKLEILISRIVKTSCKKDFVRLISLMDHWASLDSDKALAVQVLLDSGSYYASKLAEFLRAQELNIKSAINRCIESFAFDKSHTIRSVLKYSFHKIELDYLVVGNKLILEPSLVKTKVNVIMEEWTRRYKVSLEYVFDSAFSDVMHSIDFNELFGVISDLPNDKAAGLFSIPNEL